MSKKCKLEQYARVTGFFRPIKAWNPGKQSEQKKRKPYELGVTEEKESTK